MTDVIVLTQAETIRHLFEEATNLAQTTRNQGRLAVEKAAECGKLLNQERQQVESKHGKGAWSKYVQDVLKIPESTARGWMKLAESVLLEDGIDSNAIRQGMLSLDIFPAKEHEAVPGDVQLPKQISHLSLINKFAAFKRALGQRGGGRLTKTEKAQLVADFRPVVDFLKEIGAV